MSLKDKLFSFEGRLRRQDYWGLSIALGLLIFMLTEGVMLAVFGPQHSVFSSGLEASNRRVADGLPYLVQSLIACLGLWPNLAMSAKRAHDRDKSARFIVTVLAIMWIVSFVQIPLMDHYALQAENGQPSQLPMIALGFTIVGLLSLGMSLYTFIVVGCLDGTPGPNRFGPSPKAGERPEAG